jgi:hypothetical protein
MSSIQSDKEKGETGITNESTEPNPFSGQKAPTGIEPV